MRFTPEFVERIYRVGFLLVALLFVADLLTFFYYPDTVFGEIFLATREQTPLTWLSSLALLLIALSSLSAFFETKKKAWYLLAAIFFFFSMDDATYFHERLSGALAKNEELFGFFPSYIWVILYSPLLIFSLGAFIYFAWKEASLKMKKLVLSAFLILGFAELLDFADGLIQKNAASVIFSDPAVNLAFIHLMRLVEEVLEVVALGILGYVNIQRHCIVAEKKKK